MPNTFTAALDRIRRWRRAGRLVAALLGVLAVASAVALLAGLADAFAGFEPAARVTLAAAVLAVIGILLAAALGGSLHLPRRPAAKLADRLLASPRHPATAGLGLSPAGTPLSHYLADRSLEASTAALAALPARRIIPWRSLGIAAGALIIALLPLGILRCARPKAFLTVTQRLLHPRADIPPWSPLQFTLDPARPSVVYGGKLPMAVELSGATPQFPVECLIRRPDSKEILRLPAFRETPSRFSRTLEGLTEEVSVAFTCGRARSAWQTVELLLQPKVLAGEVTVTPPAYTGLAAHRSPLDSNEIAAIEGSEVTLELQSNRPLAPSALVFTPATTPGTEAVPAEITGETIATDRIAWKWTATRPGTIAATLRDVRGTPAAAPLKLTLRALPDQPPAVDLSSPPRMLLATPASRIPLTGRAEDDHGLSRVQFVRTLQGFRDRARVVAPVLQEKSFDFHDSIDLAQIGVSPGQTLEFFLDASDHNPSLLGQGASEISRIHIISEDQYAERIRASTTLDQFSARYRELARAVDEARKALEEMDRAADADNPQQTAAARNKAIDAHQRARDLLDKLADDFPAFELEKRLKELAAGGAADMRANLDALGNFDPAADKAGQRRAIGEMLDRLGRRKPQFDQLQLDAALVRKAGSLLEMAAKFQGIYQSQLSLAERFDKINREIAKGDDQNRRLLPALADTQQKNREALDAFAAELRTRAGALDDPTLDPLRESAIAFLDALAMSDPGSAMDLAVDAGKGGRAGDAFANAELARALLEGLMKKQDDPFCQACQGNCMKFSVTHPDVQQTMRQLLEGLMCQNPGMAPNQGQGAGGFGLGGSGPSGNAQPGYAMSDIPVIGPDRMRFEPPSLGQSGSREGGGSGKRRSPPTAAETSSLSPVDQPREARAAPSPESVPASYREAVKRYFTPE